MMPSTASRDDWALALARLINCLRPSWDVPGIRSAIHNARALGTREDIAIALVELSRRDDLRTPALLASDGPHWHTGRTPNARPVKTRCDVYGHEYEDAATCRLCPVEKFEPTTVPTLGVLSAAQRQINQDGIALIRATVENERGDVA
jgi:hypothetical protein